MTQSLFDSKPPPPDEPANDAPYKMRAPCKYCGNETGRIKETGAQDCVYCLKCGKHCYNAPRVETGKAVRSTQTVHAAIKPNQRARILMRATGRCELCGKKPQEAQLHVGHMVSVKNGLAMGLTEIELNDDANLCAMCDECNLGLGKETVPLRFMVAVLMTHVRRLA